MKYIRDTYKVPAEIGRRVMVYGEPGIIAADRGHYIGVNFDADKPGLIKNAHPTDGVEYLGMGTIRKPSRSRERYQRFLRSEYCGSFLDFCYWDAEQHRKEAK